MTPIIPLFNSHSKLALLFRGAGGLLAVLLLCFACQAEDVPEPIAKTKKPSYEVMVVFAPGQLGDRGYADNVMEGVNLLSFEIDDTIKNDSLDINFISPWSLISLQLDIANWASNPENPYKEGTYQRRLLVLTESFMMSMLGQLRDDLRPTDEVLVLKVNEDDVRAVAEKYGLGNRIHGLNISIAQNIRRYCRFMDQYIRLLKDNGIKEMNRDGLSFYRLYDAEDVTYRDSIYETLIEELGDSTQLVVTPVSDLESDGLYVPGNEMTVIDAAYILASAAQFANETLGRPFNIIDLGSGNSGWEYYLMGRVNAQDTSHTLVIDGDEMPLASRCYIKRFFGIALASWCVSWVESGVGAMPRMTAYTNDELCKDNIPDIDELVNGLTDE